MKDIPLKGITPGVRASWTREINLIKRTLESNTPNRLVKNETAVESNKMRDDEKGIEWNEHNGTVNTEFRM